MCSVLAVWSRVVPSEPPTARDSVPAWRTSPRTPVPTSVDSPYNSYEQKGLPRIPIGNPGERAMEAAITPTPGPWLHFVTVAPGDTRFTDSYAEQQKNVGEFNRNRRTASGS